jgi:hypothetical protein
MIIRAPELITLSDNAVSVFLAGSIERGAAVDWQTKMELALDPIATVLNPRRKDWDSTWIQSPDFPQFREQVEWELNALDTTDVIAMYFDPATKSPITLLELGLHVGENLVVCCPEGYWSRGNVQMVCEKYGVTMVPTLESLIETVTGIVNVESELRRSEEDED